MKLKLDANGGAVLEDGKPVYEDEAGKTFALDGAHLYSRVRDLTTENAGHRAARTEAEGKLKAFEGIADPVAALKAMETMANIDAGQLVAAGKIEEVKTAAKRAAEEQVAAAIAAGQTKLAEATTTIEGLTSSLYAEKIGGAFSRSKFITDKVAVPADMIQAMFQNNFKIEDGRVVAYYSDGNKVYSTPNPGSPADFEEALETLVSKYPHKDTILRGPVGSGGGAGPGAPLPGAKTMTNAQFGTLSAKERAAKMAEPGFRLTDA